MFYCSVLLVPKKCLWLFLVLCFLMHSYETLSSEFEPGGKPEVKILNPSAEAVIGAVVSVRHHGTGLFGCGQRRLDGVAVTDALSWAIDQLNQRLWSGASANISLGLHIMDSCSRTRIAASQLVDFLPELNGDEAERPTAASDPSPFKLGVIDAVGLDGEEDVSKALRDASVPVVSTAGQLHAPQDVVQPALGMVDELRWDHVAVAHSASPYSLAMLKAFTKALKKLDLCVPWIVNLEADEDAVAEAISSRVPILALLPSEEQHLLLRNLKNITGEPLAVLFTDLVLRDGLRQVSPNQVKFYAMIPLPEKEARFEEYHLRNSVMKGTRIEDELESAQRTRIARQVQHVLDRWSRALSTAMKDTCPGEKLCEDMVTPEGRSVLQELLSARAYIPSPQFALVHYQYQFPDVYVHLHKVMSYTSHKRLEVLEATRPGGMTDAAACGEDRSLPQCRCLEVNVRSESARNIDHTFGRKKTKQTKHGTEAEYIYYSAPEVRPVDHATTQPSVYAALRDPLNAALAGLTLLGAFVTMLTGQYFATSAALPRGGLTCGTSVLGYLILIGLFALFSANLSFVLTPSIATCAVRRILPNFCYAIVFSAMMIKVWASWRQTKSEKAESWRPSTLLLLSLSLSAVQLALSGAWLLLVPPRVQFESERWGCYPSADLDSHLLVSMVYIVGLLFTTAVLAIRTCSQGNNSEARWILTGSALAAVVFSCWGVAVATGVWPGYRTPSTNLLVALILLLCLYVPKIKLHSRLKRSQPDIAQYPVELDKEYPVYAARPAFPVMIDYAMGSPTLSDGPTESGFSNQAYSLDGGTVTESMSIPFEIDTSSFSEPEHEPFTFSTFLENPQPPTLSDPTQVIPSSLYPLDMFSKDDDDVAEHYQPGTNEFTPPHRTSSQMYLCPAPEWVP